MIRILIFALFFLMASTGYCLVTSNVEPDLVTPPVIISDPGPGLRVRQTTPGYEATAVYHGLYLPTDWDVNGSYPVIVEYGGNAFTDSTTGEVMSGLLETDDLGYGISGGVGFIWISMPYLNGTGTGEVSTWWGDPPTYNVDPTVDYCKKTVAYICQQYGGDPDKVLLTGFSRGSIACGYIGLHDDEIASLWRGFIPYAHYDGQLEKWPYPEDDRVYANARLARLSGKSSYLVSEHDATRLNVKAYVDSTGVVADFTHELTGFTNHNDNWTLRPGEKRELLRSWVAEVLSDDSSVGNVRQPNIIFILADDMGYSDMSWQGSPIQTPNLDKLVDRGMFLGRHYVQPQCSPTRVSFLTGNYPYRYGLHEHIVLPSSYTGIPSESKTIAEKMKESGYKTSIIGKWHVGGHKQSQLPHNQGFDHSFVCISGNISYWNYTHAKTNDLIRNGEKVYASSSLDSEKSGNTYSTYMWAKEAVKVIGGHDQKQPLFMYLSFNAPHHPLDAPKAILDKYPEGEIEAYWSGANAKKRRKANSRKYYMAMVDAMDESIGDVVDAVKSNGMAGNTLIVFCSDNGGIIEADNRPFRSGKGDSFEGGIRVPAIAYWPGTIKAGAKSNELIHVSDWYSTFAELAGGSVKNEGLDGVSARGILKGGKGKRKAVPIISAGRHALVTSDYSLVGTGENYQRLINNSLANFRLYDLKNDQSQTKVFTGQPKMEKKMEQQLAGHFKKVNRGYFNWDIKYSKYRPRHNKADHSFDYVIDDQPELSVSHTANNTTVTISPVSDKLVYNLQGSNDGKEWIALGEYVCRKNAETYVFDAVKTNKGFKKFRVLTEDHFGLPLRDSFSLKDAYKKGPLYTESDSAKLLKSLPVVEGFLPVADVSGGKQILISDNSLKYRNWPIEGGALELMLKDQNNAPSLTRYFIEPHSRGKVYASMLLQFEGSEAECIGEVNFLVQNGWNGPTEKQVSLTFQNDGIYFNQADPLESGQQTWLGEYNQKIVCVVFEFDLGATGQDVLKIYLNPDGKGNPVPAATRHGEFTFDRLQFTLSGRAGGQMKVDEIHIGRRLEDVIY